MASVTIRFFTELYRPDETITVRAEGAWNDDVTGEYERNAWTFTFQRVPGFQFKFVRNFAIWQDGANLFAGQPINEYGENVVRFVGAAFPDAEDGLVSRTFFSPDLSNTQHDVIVIGSGAGGGILAESLADAGKMVLVLEAGSYLFPTHIANLPRAHRVGQFDKHVWGLWNNKAFQFRPYVNDTSASAYNGALAYNLGGRSVFWGGLAPRMLGYEFERDVWPTKVRDALINTYYKRSEELMKVTRPRDSDYQTRTKEWLENLLGATDYDATDAPMAVQRLITERRYISAGLFSTADLLFEERATNEDRKRLVVNLNQDVRRVELDGRRVGAVVAYDRIARTERRFFARDVVLSAGALESARIAQQSGISAIDESNKLGVGLTDHQIWFVHFRLPVSSPLFAMESSAKVVVQHRAPTVISNGWNAVLEIGADWNQGRYVDPDTLREHIETRGANFMLCELVFLTASPLLEQNFVRPGDSETGRPMVVHVEKSTRASVMFEEMNALKDMILGALKAVPLAGNGANLDLNEASVGGVAHEVGSIRMGSTASNSVVDTDLKFWGVDNLYACDLSVFPTSPAANPTLALGGLAMRLADKLSVA